MAINSETEFPGKYHLYVKLSFVSLIEESTIYIPLQLLEI